MKKIQERKITELIFDYMDIVKLRNSLHKICRKYDHERENIEFPEEADILLELGKRHIRISTVEKIPKRKK